MSGQRVVVVGGRQYRDPEFVRQTLHRIRPKFIATGECPTGVDQLAKLYAMEHGIFYAGFPAPWKNGLSAGPTRNRVMLEIVKPDLVVAFAGGRGTENCVKTAQEMNIPVSYFHRREQLPEDA